MPLEPYLSFDGRCEEAIEFYKKALGAEVTMMMRFGEAPPNPAMPPTDPNKIMHSNITINGSQIMASDGRCTGKPTFQGFSLSLDAKTEADADRMFGALGDGGQVVMPLSKTFWSPRFGMLTDRFGVMWMISVPPG